MIITERFIFLNNPHTGSRTCSNVFEALGYKIEKKWGHHVPPSKIPNNLPKVTIIREPVDWLSSWYNDYKLNEEFQEWVERFEFPFDWPRKERLNIYEDVTDFYFKYEDGLEYMFNIMGYDTGPLPKIGRSSYKVDLEPYRDLIEYKFAADFEVYEKVLGGYKTWPRPGNVMAVDMIGGTFHAGAMEALMGSVYCNWDIVTSCGNPVLELSNVTYCPYCGRRVKWESMEWIGKVEP